MAGRNGWLGLVGFGTVVAAAALVRARFSPRDPKARIWYDNLEKPGFTPPGYVFPAVWSALYGLIAISGWRVWREEDSPERSKALRLWATQLAANAGWTEIFFGEHRPKRALADIVGMEAAIVGYMAEAAKVDRTAAICFTPYAVWVAFAALLNEEIVRRNPDAESRMPETQVA